MHSRPRVTVACTLLTAAAVSASVLAGAPRAWASPAAPPGDTITFSLATVTALGGAGGETLAVTADSSNSTVTSVTVHLVSTATGKDALDLQLTPPPGGAQPGAGTWTSSPLAPPGVSLAGSDPLPLGTYRMTADATDMDGPGSGPVGSLPFLDRVQITLAKSNYVLSYTNQHPAFGGTAIVSAPGATDSGPYSGPLVLRSAAEGSVPFAVKGAGYWAKLPHPKAGEVVTAEAPRGATATAGGAAPPVTLTDQISPVMLAAKLSAAKVRYGTTVKVSGTANYSAGESARPLTGQTVQVDNSSGKIAATATVDSSGHFTATLPSAAASQTWTVHAGGQYLKPAVAALPMTVELPTAITGFQATLDTNGGVDYQGCLGLAPNTPGFVPPFSGLVIQYSASQAGPWQTLGAATSKHRYACGNDGVTFNGKLPAKLDRAYYRAYFGGSATHPAGTSSKDPATAFLPAVTGGKLAWKYADRITGLAVSSRTVPVGGKLTVSGRLQAFVKGRWQNYTRQVVQVILFPGGGKGWYWITRVKTSSKGVFSSTFVDPVSATWSAEYLGNPTHLAAVGAFIPVTLAR
jgi:hypothetical protein